MKKGTLLLANFDARIPKIKIKPKNSRTTVIFHAKMYDEAAQKTVSVKIRFEDVAALEFSVNYFDNMIGAEGMGLYEIQEDGFLDSLVQRNFLRRREVYLLEGDDDYDPAEEADMLNVLDLSGDFARDRSKYHVYVQNVDAGVYIIAAKNFHTIYGK